MLTGDPLSESAEKYTFRTFDRRKINDFRKHRPSEKNRRLIGVMMSQGYLQEAEMIMQNHSGDENPSNFSSYSFRCFNI